LAGSSYKAEEKEMSFPIDVASFLTLGGVTAFTALAMQWLKKYLPDWRFTNLVALVLALITAEGAQWVIKGAGITGGDVFVAALIGFGGASIATFGYETVSNVTGILGKGKRVAK
jgi:hypothetical protein